MARPCGCNYPEEECLCGVDCESCWGDLYKDAKRQSRIYDLKRKFFIPYFMYESSTGPTIDDMLFQKKLYIRNKVIWKSKKKEGWLGE